MEGIKYNESGLIELTVREAKTVNGGAPTRSTSFFYDACYYITTGIGKVYKAAADEGIFTRSWWADYSIDLIS